MSTRCRNNTSKKQKEENNKNGKSKIHQEEGYKSALHDKQIKDALEGITGAIVDSNKKEWSYKDIISILTFVIAVISIVLSIKASQTDEFNKPILFSEQISVVHTNDNKEENDNKKSKLTFAIEQGEIKSAYLVNFGENDQIIYGKANYEWNDKELILSRVRKNTEEDVSDAEISEDYADSDGEAEGIVDIHFIQDFAFVILDTTNQWSVYYIVTSPEFIPLENAAYQATVTNESSSGVEFEGYKGMEIQESVSIIIEGQLTNISTIENQLSKLSNDYYLFSASWEVDLKSGGTAELNPRMELGIEHTDPEIIYNRIQLIYDDIKTTML